MNDERKKISGTYLVLLPILLSLFLIEVSVIMKVACLGAIGSILILLQYIFYYIKTIRRKKMGNIFREKIIKNDKWGEEFVDDNADLEGILFYRYYKDGEESGVMLIYETCHCSPNANIDKFMGEYNDILLKEYDKLNKAEIYFLSATEERAYASFIASIYGKDYFIVFIISAKSYVEQKELDLKVERLKRNFILRSKL